MNAVLTPDGFLLFGAGRVRAAIGRGLVRSDKQEGDGATPAGTLPLRRVLYRADRVPKPRAAVPVEPIAPDDGWCDDPAHDEYNRQVQLPHPARCEELWRRDGLYDLVGVLGWNDSPVQRGRGSAIFLHVASPDYAPTEGCVAVSLAALEEMLAAGLTGVVVPAP